MTRHDPLGAGVDILVGGNGDDTLTDITPSNVNNTDTLYGGPGVDYFGTSDQDDLDRAYNGAGAGGALRDGLDQFNTDPAINEP